MTDESRGVEVRRHTIADANILDVEVVTTGPKGGDYSHGAWATVKLINTASTAWDVDVDYDDFLGLRHVCIEVQGDSELRTLAAALRWAAEQLDPK